MLNSFHVKHTEEIIYGLQMFDFTVATSIVSEEGNIFPGHKFDTS
jgi:hypothetical protein